MPAADACVFDVQRAMERVAGDKEFLIELVEIFERELPHNLEKLKIAAGSGDLSTVADTAHSIKSALGNLGAVAACQLADSIERKSRQGEPAGLFERLQGLEDNIVRFREAFKSFAGGVAAA